MFKSEEVRRKVINVVAAYSNYHSHIGTRALLSLSPAHSHSPTTS
jgi:hypothetical protein